MRRACGGIIALALCASGMQCGRQEVGDAVFSPVFIVGTELLAPPAVARNGVYKPELALDIDASDPSAGRAAGFYVTVAVASPQDLQMRLIDTRAGGSRPLARLDQPAATDAGDAAAALRALVAQAREQLVSGTPVYSLVNGTDVAAGLEQRVAVLIPEALLSGFDALEVFASVADDGSPMGMDRIEIVHDFFYMASIGDSIMWGNGLRDEDKFPTLVASEIEARTGKRVIRQMHAVSAAKILPHPGDAICRVDCNGEVPKAMTSILTQVELIEHPELMGVILVDGGMNDVGVLSILNPQTDEQQLLDEVDRYCGDEMHNLLEKVRAAAPQARIVVTGYYSIVSAESDPFGVLGWLDLLEVAGEETSDTLATIAARMDRVVVATRTALTGAIDAVNAAAGEAVVALADPNYGPANAVFAPDPWVYGLSTTDGLASTWLGELELFPEDPLFEMRLVACQDDEVVANPIGCVFASVGHPNPRGARAYADAIIAVLPGLGVVPE